MGFQQGVSGLNAAAKSLDVISNNVSNQGTVGFKSSSARFADIYASQNGSVGMQIGIGATVGSVTQQFGQGTVTVTNNPLDVAINGNGFFRLSRNGETIYSRNGQFDLDKSGYVVNSNGAQLTGYARDASGNIDTSRAQPLQISTKPLPPMATGQASSASATLAGLTLGVNVDSRLSVPGSPWNAAVSQAVPPYTTSVSPTLDAAGAVTVTAESKADATLSNMVQAWDSSASPPSATEKKNMVVGKVMEGLRNVVDSLTQTDATNGAQIPLTSLQKRDLLTQLEALVDAAYTAAPPVAPPATSNFMATLVPTITGLVATDSTVDSTTFSSPVTTALAATLSANDLTALQTAAINSVGVSGKVIPKIDTYNYTTSVDVYDSEGVAHQLTYYFAKDRDSGPVDPMTHKPTPVPGLWHVYVSVDQTNPANITLDSGLYPGQPLDLMFDGSGNLEYMGYWDKNQSKMTTGPLDPVTKTPLTTLITANKLVPGTSTTLNNISIDLVGVQNDLKAVGITSSTKVESPLMFKSDMSGITQFGTVSSTSKVLQDGYPSGELAGLSVSKNGMIQGRYSNGQTLDLGQVVIASFSNNNGLMALGGNAWAQTLDSGQPSINPPGVGVAGTVVSGSVENSNVDLTQAMVDMIAQQRAYQANSQSIKTQDQILQTIVNLK